jgi:membrane-associated protease RseP (regulator of RpoE activity)
MDMIGRIREGKVYVGGVTSGSTFKTLLDELAPKSGLALDFSELSVYGSSDHTSFTARQVPVLFFFSGLHADYHKPTDTWEKIDAPQTAVLLRFVADVATSLASATAKPQFVRVEPPSKAHAGSAHSGSGSSGGGYGPDFGSIPDFAEVPNGVKFAGIRTGSPAEEAGLLGGDILVEFDGKPIQNLYDFTYALRAKRPGDEVTVKVLRGGESVEAKVKLRARR